MVDSRTDTPLKMTEAKRKAHVWAVFFHTLETIDVITVSECLLACFRSRNQTIRPVRAYWSNGLISASIKISRRV